MSDQTELEPVHAGEAADTDGRWTERLVIFLRVMAGVSMLKGLYHWSVVCGIGEGLRDGLRRRTRSPFRPRPCSSR